MTAEEAFDRAFSQYGGRCDIEALPDLAPWHTLDVTARWPIVPGVAAPPSRSVLRWYLHRARQAAEFLNSTTRVRTGAPPLHIDFVADDTFNAAAQSVGDWVFVGINVGVIPTLHGLFGRLLRSSSCVPWLPTDERDLASPHIPLPTVVHSWRELLQDGRLLAPHNVMRNYYAQSLAWWAFDYLVLHELGHVWNGHCAYDSRCNRPIRHERMTRQELHARRIDQCLEMNADAFAIARQVRAALGKDEYAGYDALVFGTPELALFHVLFSMYATWRLFASEAEAEWSIAELTHFPPTVRQISNAANVLAVLEYDQRPELASRVTDIWRDAVIQIEAAFELSAASSTRRKRLGADTIPHVADVYAAWAEVYAHLEPLARYDGLAPRPAQHT